MRASSIRRLGVPTSSRQGVTVRCPIVLSCGARFGGAGLGASCPRQRGRGGSGRAVSAQPRGCAATVFGIRPWVTGHSAGDRPHPREFGAFRLGVQSWTGKRRGGLRPSGASPCNPPGSPERRRGVRPSGGSASRFGRGAVSAASGGRGASSIHPPEVRMLSQRRLRQDQNPPPPRIRPVVPAPESGGCDTAAPVPG